MSFFHKLLLHPVDVEGVKISILFRHRNVWWWNNFPQISKIFVKVTWILDCNNKEEKSLIFPSVNRWKNFSKIFGLLNMSVKEIQNLLVLNCFLCLEKIIIEKDLVKELIFSEDNTLKPNVSSICSGNYAWS